MTRKYAPVEHVVELIRFIDDLHEYEKRELVEEWETFVFKENNKKTRFDKVKGMKTEAEMAEWWLEVDCICNICVYEMEYSCEDKSCRNGIAEYLNQEAEE